MFWTSDTSISHVSHHKFNVGINNMACLYYDCYFFISDDFLLPLTDKFTLRQ